MTEYLKGAPSLPRHELLSVALSLDAYAEAYYAYADKIELDDTLDMPKLADAVHAGNIADRLCSAASYLRSAVMYFDPVTDGDGDGAN